MPAAGRLLHVDLTCGAISETTIPAETMRVWRGGRGLGVHLLAPLITHPPLAAAQGVVLAPGLLCGTATPAADRFSLVFRSPLTGTIDELSEGGALALQLRGCGFAAVLITGVSACPVILELTPAGAKLRAGAECWGEGADVTVARLGEDGAGVLAIGPAGEAQVPLATVHCGDGSVVGRGGAGAVLGSKGLKAIVVHGAAAAPVADPAAFAAARGDLLRLFRASPVLLGELGFATFGDAGLVDLAAQRGLLATANFRAILSPAAAAVFSGPALKKHFAPVNGGCGGCPIACKLATPDGSPLPGFAGLTAFGALAGVDSLEEIVRLQRLCNRLGLDPVSTAGVLAVHRELTGLPPAADLAPLIEGLARRSGEGAALAAGARHYAAALGRPETALTVKGLELAPLDPRGLCGLALATCVSSNGSAEHAFTLGPELLRKPVPVDPRTFDGKARLVRLAEDAVAAADSLGLCRYALLGAGMEEGAALAAAVTGEELRAADLMALGDRVVRLERACNQANGFTAADDILPERLLTDAPSQPLPPLDRGRLTAEVARYYRIRGIAADGCVPEDRSAGEV